MKFDEIYNLYFPDVYKYLRCITESEHLAEELTAETFYKALKSIHTYRGDCEIRIWLCHIAKNCWFSYCKKHNRLTSIEDSNIELTNNLSNDNSNSKDFIQTMEEKETLLQIHRILHKLNEPYKEVFTLRIFGELSFKHIGDLFDKNEHWACVTFHRAKTKIQILLGGTPE